MLKFGGLDKIYLLFSVCTQMMEQSVFIVAQINS